MTEVASAPALPILLSRKRASQPGPGLNTIMARISFRLAAMKIRTFRGRERWKEFNDPVRGSEATQAAGGMHPDVFAVAAPTADPAAAPAFATGPR